MVTEGPTDTIEKPLYDQKVFGILRDFSQKKNLGHTSFKERQSALLPTNAQRMVMAESFEDRLSQMLLSSARWC